MFDPLSILQSARAEVMRSPYYALQGDTYLFLCNAINHVIGVQPSHKHKQCLVQ